MVYALRTDGTTTKAYEFIFGIAAGGTHVMGGNNFKSHPYHHVTSPSFNWSQVFGTSLNGNPW